MSTQKMSRRGLLTTMGAVGASALIAPPVFADNWPSRPIKMIVPYPPGGAADIIARVVNNHLSDVLGVPLVVENRPGASTIIAAEATARSEPDGYTLLIASTTTMCVIPNISGSKAQYDAKRDFTPISSVSRAPFFFMVPTTSDIKDLASLIAHAKAKPGSLSYGSNGLGSASHLGMLLFEKTSGIDMLHVPYKSISLAGNDLLTGTINLVLGDLSTVAGLVKDGRIRLIASASPQRSPLAPDIPTVAEATGIDIGDVGPWFGILGPAKLPPEIVKRLNEGIRAFASSDAARQTYNNISQLPLSSSPEEFAQLIQSDSNRFAAIIKENNITLE